MADFPYEREVDAAHQMRDPRPRTEKRRFPVEAVLALGDELLELLAPECQRVVIAGSARRGVEWVSDLELVAEPVLERDLFGGVDESARSGLEVRVDELLAEGRLQLRETSAGIKRNGSRFKALAARPSFTHEVIPVDLFLVRPPASWGALLTIRTGPDHYSRDLVTRLRHRGMRCERGHVLRDNGEEVSTPEEVDFFRACGLPYVEPWERR